MNAPTPRETADHAELARLADRLRIIANDYIGKVDRASCIETESADAIEALLSEIAALRGEVERVEADRIRTVDDRMTWTRRTLQAERQRDELLSFVRKLDCECDPSFSTASCGRCVQLANQGADQ